MLAAAVEELLQGRRPDDLFAGGRAVSPSCGLDFLQVAWLTHLWRSRPPEQVPAAPGVARCEADGECACMALDPTVEGWLSTGVSIFLNIATPAPPLSYPSPSLVYSNAVSHGFIGLYVPPGVAVSIQCLGPHAGWSVRIGCHTDTLWHLDEWARWPDVVSTHSLREDLVIASPFGGLLYFEAGAQCESVDVIVTGVARAPFFDSTTMSLEDWLRVRVHPGPWAELAGRHVIITVPSSCVRDLDDASAVMSYWDKVVTSHCDLKACAPPSRRERLVADVQISAGYMHSGYPVSCLK